jgi:hypothetical protein
MEICEILLDGVESLTQEGWKDWSKSISKPDRSVGLAGLVFINRLKQGQSG